MTTSGPLDWIETKKRGGAHRAGELKAIVEAATGGTVPDYQLAAWLMAVWQRGMTRDEMVALTLAMRDSGIRLKHDGSLGPTADKHSTGGVGDKVSLVVAPLASAMGFCVPMISGRGLGHTGGTLDKLQAIPGYRVDLSRQEFESVLARAGCSIIGQTDEIAPADRRLYALRDVTGTVDSIPLIVSSILSKKLAAGPAHLVIDLKCGSGAFMTDLQSARALARALVRTGSAAGLKMSALVTDMGQPLGRAIGHANEVAEALDCLSGRGPQDLRELSIELCAELAQLAGMGSLDESRARAMAALDDGSAMERFQRMVVAHGGNLHSVGDLRIAPEQEPLVALRSGYVDAVATAEVGRAVIDLGGGRRRHTDEVDLSVGLEWEARVGEAVEAGQPLFRIFATDAGRARMARERLGQTVRLADTAPEPLPLVRDRIAG